jgi:hypothetical protein
MLLIAELLWIAIGTTLGAIAARRHDSLGWLLAGIAFGPLTVIALVLPRRAATRQSVLRGGRP